MQDNEEVIDIYLCVNNFHVWCVALLLLLLLLLLLVITFMQGIYSYIPDTNLALGAYNAAAVLCLRCMVHVILLPVLNVS
jgi:hypothetical protein